MGYHVEHGCGSRHGRGGFILHTLEENIEEIGVARLTWNRREIAVGGFIVGEFGGESVVAVDGDIGTRQTS